MIRVRVMAEKALVIGTVRRPPHRLTLREQLEEVERNLLNEALQQHNGNQTLTARMLGLPRRTLLYRMQRLGVALRPRSQAQCLPK